MRIFLLFALMALCSLGVSQESVLEKLSTYIKFRPQEKVYLHTNKDIYSPGETIWFKPYHFDGYTSKPSPLSQVLYVDVVNGTGAIYGEVKVNLTSDEGGSIDLPDTMKNDTYYLRAYTSYQLNFENGLTFKKPFKIINELKDPLVDEETTKIIPFNIRFFPEGGHLIDGLVNNIGFKSINQYGLSAQIEGKILNQNGETITSFSSGHAGIGSFKLIPNINQRYTASIIYRNLLFEFPIPEIETNGPLLNVTMNLKTIAVKVLAKDYNLTDHYVLGYQNGSIFLNTKTPENKEYIYAKFGVENLKTGIAHFTLFNAIDQPIAERICFVKNGAIKEIAFSIENEVSTKSKVSAKTNQIDRSDKLINASVTVYDFGLKNEYANNIISDTYLSSDLKGYVEDPYYYFQNLDEDRFRELDNLMLTQGWTRFQWHEVLRDTLSPIKYFLEQSPTVKGQLFNYWNRSKTREGMVSLFILEAPLVNIETQSSPEGYFQFGSLDFGDSVNLIIQAKKIGKKAKKNPEKEHNDNYYIDIKNIARPNIANNVLLVNEVWDDIVLRAQELEERYRQIERSFNDDVIILEAFEIITKKDQYATGIGNQALIYNKPTRRYELDSMDFDPRLGAINMQDLISSLQIPGFSGGNLSSRGASTFTGSNQVAFFYNGRQVDQEFVLQDLSPGDVGTIDYFTGNQASIFGALGASGVIAIYPRSKGSSSTTLEIVGVTNMKFIGFNEVKEFYQASIEPETKPDYRRALYWTPKVNIDEQGQAIVNFNTSDAKGEFIIEIQGINDLGQPVYGQKVFYTTK